MYLFFLVVGVLAGQIPLSFWGAFGNGNEQQGGDFPHEGGFPDMCGTLVEKLVQKEAQLASPCLAKRNIKTVLVIALIYMIFWKFQCVLKFLPLEPSHEVVNAFCDRTDVVWKSLAATSL